MCLIDVKIIITTLNKIQPYVEGTNNTLVGNRFKGAAVTQLSLLPSIGCRTVHGYLNGKSSPMVVTIDGSVLIINTQECDK